MLIRITRWLDGKVLHEIEAVDQKDALQRLVLRGADLRDADLRGADLRGAYLRGADLTDANLRGAYLTGANLRGANLRGANLRDAYLRGAYLRGANLTDADLAGANLRDANLRDVRDDLWAVLSGAPAEVPALLQALREGKVDGSTYSGACACLVGTLANARGCDYHGLAPAIVADSDRLAEVWFTAIKPGDTPENSQSAKLAAEWIEDWLTRMRAAFGPPATTPGTTTLIAEVHPAPEAGQ